MLPTSMALTLGRLHTFGRHRAGVLFSIGSFGENVVPTENDVQTLGNHVETAIKDHENRYKNDFTSIGDINNDRSPINPPTNTVDADSNEKKQQLYGDMELYLGPLSRVLARLNENLNITSPYDAINPQVDLPQHNNQENYDIAKVKELRAFFYDLVNILNVLDERTEEANASLVETKNSEEEKDSDMSEQYTDDPPQDPSYISYKTKNEADLCTWEINTNGCENLLVILDKTMRELSIAHHQQGTLQVHWFLGNDNGFDYDAFVNDLESFGIMTDNIVQDQNKKFYFDNIVDVCRRNSNSKRVKRRGGHGGGRGGRGKGKSGKGSSKKGWVKLKSNKPKNGAVASKMINNNSGLINYYIVLFLSLLSAFGTSWAAQ